jgi:hypothetical protein
MAEERRLRTVREQPLFEERKRQISDSPRRLDERFDAVVWAASSSDVSDFPLIPHTDVRVARLDSGGKRLKYRDSSGTG